MSHIESIRPFSSLMMPPPHTRAHTHTDLYWVQDFPVGGASGGASEGVNKKLKLDETQAIEEDAVGLPPVEKDGQPFRRTLRCFLEALINRKAPEKKKQTLLDRLAPLLDGVDFSGARGTLVASVPSSATNLEHNGLHALSDALKDLTWPARARSQPVNYITGALGNIVKDEWLQLDFLKSATAGGVHGGFPKLRIVWPNNATVFAGANHVAWSLGHDWRYYTEKVSVPCVRLTSTPASRPPHDEGSPTCSCHATHT